MCLIALHHWPKIAWKPITVYKRLHRRDNGVFTPCVYHGVESEQLMRANRFPLYTKRAVYYGIHAYTSPDIAKRCAYDEEFVVKATIPRFSLYYLGTYNEICSNRLKLTKKIIYGRV